MSKTLRWVFLILNWIGLIVALWLLVLDYNTALALKDPFCIQGEFVNCAKVAASKYSFFPPGYGIPVAMLGIVAYFFILAVFNSKRLGDETKYRVLLNFYLIQFLFIFYLIYVCVTEIHVLCPYCILTYVIIFISFWVLWAIAKWKIGYLNPVKALKEVVSRPVLKLVSTDFVIPLLVGILFHFVVVDLFFTYVAKAQGVGASVRRAGSKVAENIQKPSHSTHEIGIKLTGYPIKGDIGAPLKVIEYTDFGCPFCAKGAHNLDDALKEFSAAEVALIVKPYPLDSKCNPRVRTEFHPGACYITYVSYAAYLKDPDKFWDFYHTVFDYSVYRELSDLARDGYEAGNYEALKKRLKQIWVKKLGFSESEFDNIFSEEFVAKAKLWVKAAAIEGAKLRLRGVPFFVIGRKIVAGAYPSNVLRKVIESELNNVLK